MEEKPSYYDELNCEWDMHSADNLVVCLGHLKGHVGRHFDGCMEGMVLVRGILKKEYYWSFFCRRNYVCQMHGLRERKGGR